MSLRINQDKAELRKQKVTVTSVAVVTTKFLFGICDCTVDSDVGKGDSFRAGAFACVDTCTCDRTCLRAWTGLYAILFLNFLTMTF